MSSIIRAAAALLDASYQIEDTAKADTWREMAVEARREYDKLLAERDKAQSNYQFMVERVADQKLDGYRELGARAADAENERDNLSRELDRVKKEKDKIYEELERLHRLAPVGSYTVNISHEYEIQYYRDKNYALSNQLENATKQRDEAAEELETLKALIEGEPWAGAVMRRERDQAREDLEDAREAVNRAHEALRATEKREIDAIQALDEAVALLREAQISRIEAVTEMNSGVDGLSDLMNRMQAFIQKA